MIIETSNLTIKNYRLELMKKLLTMLLLLVSITISCRAQAKLEKFECDTANLDVTMVLSCPQSKDILYRAAKEWLATHIQNFQQRLQYDDKETGTIKFKNSSYLHAKKLFRQTATIDMVGTFNYMVTITIKDCKYRVKVEDGMANWHEDFIFNGTRSSNGTKELDLKNFVRWSEDRNAIESYSGDISKIADGIWLHAKELENDDF